MTIRATAAAAAKAPARAANREQTLAVYTHEVGAKECDQILVALGYPNTPKENARFGQESGTSAQTVERWRRGQSHIDHPGLWRRGILHLAQERRQKAEVLSIMLRYAPKKTAALMTFRSRVQQQRKEAQEEAAPVKARGRARKTGSRRTSSGG